MRLVMSTQYNGYRVPNCQNRYRAVSSARSIDEVIGGGETKSIAAAAAQYSLTSAVSASAPYCGVNSTYFTTPLPLVMSPFRSSTSTLSNILQHCAICYCRLEQA